MATVALAGAGALLGGAAGFGSIGASVGWALGGLAGSLLFPPRGQDTTGPRLSDLSVQSSAYGAGIPVLFGTTRLAGNIIWSSGLQESVTRRRVGGKGAPRATATTYSYSASWAVGLCEGPAAAVRRIWFDDKLVFDSSGASTQIEVPGLVWRFYPGDETQLPDPLIEAAVGADNAVAHRGLAYIVFDDVPLERVGNRVPNVTVEVVMQGGLSVQADAITGRPSPVNGEVVAVDFASRRLWTTTSGLPVRIVETQLDTLTSRVAVTTNTANTINLAAVPGVGLIASRQGGNTTLVERYDPESGGLTGTFSTTSINVNNTTTSVTTVGLVPQDLVPLQVRGLTGTRSFVLMSPFAFQAGGYCLDVDNMTYVWGSTLAGHPRLFQPTVRGHWVAGEQRPEETDAFYIAPQADGFEVWRLGVTSAAAGILVAPQLGGTLGVNVTQLPLITNASMGFGAGTMQFRQAILDLEDGHIILAASLGGVDRLAKFTRAGVVLWSAPGSFSLARSVHLSRLDAGLLGVLGPNVLTVYSTRSGALVATQPVPGLSPSTGGWQVWDGSTRALYAQTQTGGAQRFLAMRQSSSAITLSSIAQALCARAGLDAADVNASALTDSVAGYVLARPGSVRSALEPLAAAYLFDAVESDDVLRFVRRGGAPAATVNFNDLVRANQGSVITETRAQDAELPRQLTVRHISAERSYEPGAQHWQRPAAPTPTMRSRDVQSMDLPIVLTADEAKGIARRLLTATWRERSRLAVSGTTQHLLLEPADAVTMVLGDGSTQRARIVSAQLGADWSMRFEAVAEAAADYTLTAPADGGRGFRPDAMPAPYGIRGLVPNIPLLRDGDDLAGTGLRGYAFAGTFPGQTFRPVQVWRGPLNALDVQGAIGASMTWGAVVGSVPVPASYWTWDDVTTITLVPQIGAQRIVSATDLEVLNGANMGLLVSPAGVVEIIQHAVATANPDGTITLSRLLRGRRGTEDAGVLGSPVYVLLDGADLRFSGPLAALNQPEQFRLQGIFQQVQEAPAVLRTNTGRAERPFAPVSIVGTRDGSNNLTITWQRRTRIGGEWLDGTGDVPLGEASQAFEVLIRNAANTATLRTIGSLTTPTASYTAALQTTDFGSVQAAINVQVFQLSATVGRGIAGVATV